MQGEEIKVQPVIAVTLPCEASFQATIAHDIPARTPKKKAASAF